MADITYVVDKHLTDRAEAAAACSAVLDVLGPRLHSATIDAYSDYQDVMTPEATDAQLKLRAIGRMQGGRDTGMAVELDLADQADRALLRAFAPWSIHVDLCGKGSREVATFHDCGFSICVDLSADEAAALAGRLASITQVLPLSQVRERRRAERTAARGHGCGEPWRC